jgi:predicted acetyltransferase
MGFGYGVKLNRYSFRPDALPAGGSNGVDYLTVADKEELAACYDRLVARSNGLLELPPHVLDALFTDPSHHIVGYREAGQLRGYLIFRFEPAPGENWLLNNVQLRYLVYDDAASLAALLGFLRKQADQVDRIIYETQDDSFHQLLNDPRDGSGKLLAGLWHEVNTQGLGIMYRVIDTRRLYAVLGGHDFGGVSGRFGFQLTDTFLPENGGRFVVAVDNGRAEYHDDGAADVEVALDVSDFSSLVVGAADFRRLHAYGRVIVSDEQWIGALSRLFHADAPPWCMTHF